MLIISAATRHDQSARKSGSTMIQTWHRYYVSLISETSAIIEFGRRKFTGQNLTLPSRSPVDVYSLHDDTLGPDRFEFGLDRLTLRPRMMTPPLDRSGRGDRVAALSRSNRIAPPISNAVSPTTPMRLRIVNRTRASRMTVTSCSTAKFDLWITFYIGRLT